MRRMSPIAVAGLFVVGLFLLPLVVGCAGPARHEGWVAKKEAGSAAFDECRDEVDTTMRLRGYPIHPSPETPQFEYHKSIFAQCMRRKGYEAD